MDFTTDPRRAKQVAALMSGASPFGTTWANEHFLAIDPIELIKTRSYDKRSQEILIAAQAVIAGFDFTKPSTYLQQDNLHTAVVGMKESIHEAYVKWRDDMEFKEGEARWKLIAKAREDFIVNEVKDMDEEAKKMKKELRVARGVIIKLRQEVKRAGEESSGMRSDQGNGAGRVAGDGEDKSAADSND
ncbi:hypothetical protein T440DRAFT_530782 [Plenodomus tracheiphilus IPT5]|uniref:Uncharacterized protein n=1 Tax=Plenodomus tracheiphilus IPT5 TaxID=1408161 RepID=A0A6A7B595_9PLEO|nr:hypothetical protein T440DRAFT_530782 [Plenodomus tracheiphilus IPT5]